MISAEKGTRNDPVYSSDHTLAWLHCRFVLASVWPDVLCYCLVLWKQKQREVREWWTEKTENEHLMASDTGKYCDKCQSQTSWIAQMLSGTCIFRMCATPDFSYIIGTLGISVVNAGWQTPLKTTIIKCILISSTICGSKYFCIKMFYPNIIQVTL